MNSWIDSILNIKNHTNTRQQPTTNKYDFMTKPLSLTFR